MNFKKYLLLLLWLLLAALNLNLILKPLSLVTGGTQGLAIILNHLLNIKPSTIVLIINVIALIISFFLLSKASTSSAIISTFAYPLFIRLTSFIPVITFFENHYLIASIIAGITCGITGGFIYKLGFSSGGITIINLLINKYTKIKIATSNFIINFIIILLGCYYFGFMKTIYSIIVITIGSLIINKVLKKY